MIKQLDISRPSDGRFHLVHGSTSGMYRFYLCVLKRNFTRVPVSIFYAYTGSTLHIYFTSFSLVFSMKMTCRHITDLLELGEWIICTIRIGISRPRGWGINRTLHTQQIAQCPWVRHRTVSWREIKTRYTGM